MILQMKHRDVRMLLYIMRNYRFIMTRSEERNENLFSFHPSDVGTKGLLPFIM